MHNSAKFLSPKLIILALVCSLPTCTQALTQKKNVYQISGFAGNFCPVWSRHGVLPSHDLPDEHHLFAMPERRSSDQKGVHDHATSPSVHLKAVTVAFVLKFRVKTDSKSLKSKQIWFSDILHWVRQFYVITVYRLVKILW